MKKIVALIMALVLVTACAWSVAETKVETKELGFYQISMNTYTGTLYGRVDRKQGYGIYDLNGEQLSAELYDRVNARQYGYEVSLEGDPLCNTGFLSGDGKLLIPCVYGNTDAISEKWVAGIKLVNSNADNYDVKIYVTGGDNIFALIDTVDFYYEGNLAGTLTRSQYKYAGAYGDYLSVTDREGNYHHYDRAMNESPVIGSGEYTNDYKAKKIYHNGTGQVAFDPSCTLTAEEVRVPVREEKGRLYDLQGNVVADTTKYYSVYSFNDGFAKTRSKDGLYGMISQTGEELLPMAYDEVDYVGFNCGYVSVVKDGKRGFVSKDGVEQGFLYPDNAVKAITPFAYVQQLDGTLSVISAAVGELTERYAEYRNLYETEAPFAVLQDRNGSVGVVGLMGEVLVPFDGAYDSVYDLNVSRDGKAVLGNDKRIFLIDYDYDAVVNVPVTSEPVVNEAEPDTASGWVCPECGKENGEDANFCPNDGTKRPEVPAEWTCPSCGKENAPDANFCPNDGTKKP